MLSLGLAVTSSLTSIDGLVRGPYSEGGLFPRLALDFDDNKYATDVGSVTFADAFTAGSPKLTYSTTSNSTMVNSSGNIVWAPHNLVPNSEDFRASGPSSPWVHQNSATITENAITAPDDGANGTQLEFGAANNSQIRNDFGLGSTIQGTFTIRVWVKCATGTTEKVRLKSYSSGNGNQNSDDITVTDQWVLVSYSFVKSSGSSMSTYISNATDAVARTIFIWGAHLFRSDLGGMGQVPGAATGFEYYVPTSGSAKYLPRVGHHVYNGSAWVNEGLLIESEARTNLLTYSEDFSQWTASSGTTVTAGATSPTGQTDAYQITLAGNNDNVQLTTAGLSTSTAVQYSVYLRVSSGTQSVNLGNIDAGQYQSVTVTTEWQRFVITQTPSATTRFPRILNGTNDSFTVEAFGAQIEQNATASSYIPTTGATATRAAQTLVVPPAAFGWNNSAVSIQMEGRLTFADEDQSLQHQLWIWKKDNNNLIRVNYDTHSTYGSGRISFQQVESNVYDLVNTGSNVLAAGTLVSFNIASRHGSTFTNAAVDGTALTENATPTALPDLSASDLQIATDFMGTIRQFVQYDADIGDAGLVTATS
tara:strand:+ start:211 stop:1983 length:1773 start_codon:yes stop_codon:yes gene_type:complete